MCTFHNDNSPGFDPPLCQQWLLGLYVYPQECENTPVSMVFLHECTSTEYKQLQKTVIHYNSLSKGFSMYWSENMQIHSFRLALTSFNDNRCEKSFHVFDIGQ